MGKYKISDATDLTQDEADILLAMEKHCFEKKPYLFPSGGEKIRIPLIASNKREHFMLVVNSMRLNLQKYNFNALTKKVIPLVRVDIMQGPAHRNPDGEIITGSHIHRYREGAGDKWASPLPHEFGDPNDAFQVFQNFLDFCKVITKPMVSKSLLGNP